MHFIGIRSGSAEFGFYSPGWQIYNRHILYNHIQNVCLSSIPKKKRRKNWWSSLPWLLWFEVSSKRFFHHPSSLNACGLEYNSRFKSGAIKCSHASLRKRSTSSWSSVIGLVSVPKDCCLKPQGPIASSHLGVIRSTVWILDCWMDLTLAMTYTHSLTDNRASLLTILMFSTGFSVCSCTVLYTVANTLVFPVSFR